VFLPALPSRSTLHLVSPLGLDTIIGIDLGTTNCCAAVAVGPGQVKLVPYKGGTTQSLDLAIDDKTSCRTQAKRQCGSTPAGLRHEVERSPKTAWWDVQPRAVSGTGRPGDIALDCTMPGAGRGAIWLDPGVAPTTRIPGPARW
jgi:hypothetical protein